jgi:hypothetical protein
MVLYLCAHLGETLTKSFYYKGNKLVPVKLAAGGAVN